MSEKTETASTATDAPAKKASRGRKLKILRRVSLILGAVLLVAIAGARIAASRVIHRTIEEKGTEALGTAVTVEDVSLSLLRGGAKISGLRIAQPGGEFGDRPILELDSLWANVSLSRLLAGKIHIDAVKLDEPSFYLLRNASGVTNLNVLLEIMKRKTAEAAAAPPSTDPDDDGSTKAPAEQKTITLALLQVKDLSITLRDETRTVGPKEFTYHQGMHRVSDLVFDPGAMTGTVGKIAYQDIKVAWPEGSGFQDGEPFSVGEIEIAMDLAPALDGSFIRIRELNIEEPYAHIEESVAKLKNTDALKEIARAFAPPKAEDRAPETGDAPPAGGEPAEVPEVKPSTPFHLVRLLLEEGKIIVTEQKESGVSVMEVTAIEVDVRDFSTAPESADQRGQYTIRAHPLVEDSKVTIKILDNLARDFAQRDINFDVQVERLPIPPLLKEAKSSITLREGQASLSMKGTLVEQRLKSDVVIHGHNIHTMRQSDGRERNIVETVGKAAGDRALLTAIELLKKPGTDDTLPIEFSINERISGRNMRDTMRSLLTTAGTAFINTLRNAITNSAGAVGGLAVDGAKGAANLAGDGVEAVGGVVGDAAKGVGDVLDGGIKSIFGGGKSDEEKKREKEEKEKKKAP